MISLILPIHLISSLEEQADVREDDDDKDAELECPPEVPEEVVPGEAETESNVEESQETDEILHIVYERLLETA